MKLILFIAIALWSALPTIVQAQEDEGSGYDSLVKELKSTLRETPIAKPETRAQHISFGAAFAGDYVSSGGKGTPSGSAMLGGFDLHCGLEMAPTWNAEFGFRSFGSGRMAPDYTASLTEYEAKFVHESVIQRHLYLRAGGGLSLRFLKTIDTRNNGFSEGTEQGPALGFLIGVDRRLTSKVSFGPDVSIRTPVSNNTTEKTSADASLRMNFLF